MTPTLPHRHRAPDLFLVAAMLLLSAAGLGQRVLEHERSLASTGRALAASAGIAESYARLSIGTAMRTLDGLATAAGGDAAAAAESARPGGGLAQAARVALASSPGARFVALVDGDGKLVASAGQPDPALLGEVAEKAQAGPADAANPAWYFVGTGSLLAVRRVIARHGGFGGVAVLAMGPGWMDQIADSADLGAGGGMLLLDAGRRVIMRAPSNRAGPGGLPAPGAVIGDPATTPGGLASDLVETRTVLPGQLELLVARDTTDVLRAWWMRSGYTVALLLCVLGLLLAGWLRARQRIQRLQTANLHHVRQLAQLATASERLSRLRDVDEIVGRAEAIGRSLLACERVDVVLGNGTEPAAEAMPQEPDGWRHGISLLSAGGERLGRITVTRAAATALTSEEDLVLEQFARAVASALEGATLLADTMRSKSELELILSTISDGMFVLDRGWSVRYANAAAARYLQHQREEMLGANVWALLPGLRDGDMGERLEAAAGQGQDAVFTSFYPPLNAWFEMRAYPFASGLTVYFRDVTNQRETEEKLRQAQKLEAVGQLTGGIAHDVNNLLTVILGNLELLAMRAEDRLNGVAAPEPDGEAGDEDERGLDLTLAEAGLRAGESASQLMHRLLAFSRRQPLTPQVVAVGELLQSLQPLVRRTMTEQVSLRMHWPAELWHAMIDPAELESAILNLSINAQDAMPGGGVLTIEATNVAIDRVYAAVAGLDHTGDFIMISVSDTGTGMAKDVMARAFDPFFTTKAPGKGTGLGLSMVYGFVRQSGGHVLIDSEPGQGTMVRMYLPRTLPARADDRPSARAGVAGGHETILLVEDNELVRAHTEAMLRGLGYDVVSAADGPAAVRVLAEGLRPDLLLTDVILPRGMTGRDVADEAQRFLPGLRVLFISGYSGNVLMENGRLPPGVDLLGKPFRRSELAARIRAQLGTPRHAAHAPTAHAASG
jgi:PAS domain S-box-containing protein